MYAYNIINKLRLCEDSLTRLQSFSLAISTSNLILSILSSCRLSSIFWISALSVCKFSWSFYCGKSSKIGHDWGLQKDGSLISCSDTSPQPWVAGSASLAPSELVLLSRPGWYLPAEGSAVQPADGPGAARTACDPSERPWSSDRSSGPQKRARRCSDAPEGCAFPSAWPRAVPNKANIDPHCRSVCKQSRFWY